MSESTKISQDGDNIEITVLIQIITILLHFIQVRFCSSKSQATLSAILDKKFQDCNLFELSLCLLTTINQ